MYSQKVKKAIPNCVELLFVMCWNILRHLLLYQMHRVNLKQYYEMWWESKNLTFHFFSSYIYVMTFVVTVL